MGAGFARWIAGALLCATAAISPARGDEVADRLSDLTRALQAVRAVKASNVENDAGPELTPVKVALRRWVEAQLPPVSEPGQAEGTIETPTVESLSALARHLSDELDQAKLICGGSGPASPQCKGSEAFVSERGYVGGVQLGLLDYGRYLLLVTGVGVQCGEDQSAYLYKGGPGGWKLVFASEQDDYRKDVYKVQNFTEIAVSGWAGEAQPDTPPLVATLGYAPWCSSAWSALYTRLWRMSATSVTPKPLVDRTDGLWWGGDDFGSAELTANDLLVQHTDASIDTGVHHRMHVRHYRVGLGDRVERADPVALSPRDFVDEWLVSDWKEAGGWIEPGADRSGLLREHGKFDYNRWAYTFDGTKRCRNDRSLWQVALAREPQDPNDHSPATTSYFKVRWTAPYVFRLVTISGRPSRECNVIDAAGEEERTLFPKTQWHPTD